MALIYLEWGFFNQQYVEKTMLDCCGFRDARTQCALALLPVGVSVSVGGAAVGTRARSVTVGEQTVSLIDPPRPPSTITLLCLSPPTPWQHHMIAEKKWESSCCVSRRVTVA